MLKAQAPYAPATPVRASCGPGVAKGLHALPQVPLAADQDAMRAFLALLPEQGTRSFFAGVERVPAGHVALVTRAGVELRRYWDPAPSTLRLKRPEEYDEAVREAF